MPRGYQVPSVTDVSCQQLKSITIENLKCLKNVTLSFPESSMVAIMAPNGCGKSSILHAIYCSFNIPGTNSSQNHFSKFFRPTSLNSWDDSEFSIVYSFRRRSEVSDNVTKRYKKSTDRWCKYESRPIRNVEYIGIGTCVPLIELYASKKKITFVKRVLDSREDVSVKERASMVMNRNYNEYCQQEANTKKLIGVECSNVEYSAFSMGAGEQRIFYILDKVIKAPKYSLILVDEIELFLHEDALSRLLDVLRDLCEAKHHQIIFTTHARSILSKGYINFRNLYQVGDRTICLDKCYPEFLTRLTGHPERQYEIFVEDLLAQTIVQQLCLDCGVKSCVDIKKFGTATIGVKSACGMVCTNPDATNNMLFVTDGDRQYYNQEWYNNEVNSFFAGDDPVFPAMRSAALDIITRFVMPDGEISPEEYYRNAILELNRGTLSIEEQTIYDQLYRVVVPADTHDYFNTVIDNLGFSKEVGYAKIIELLKKNAATWREIVRNVQLWIDSKMPEMRIPE